MTNLGRRLPRKRTRNRKSRSMPRGSRGRAPGDGTERRAEVVKERVFLHHYLPEIYSAAMFGVNSSGSPRWPVSFSPSSHIANARFFSAGKTAATRSVSISAAIPG